MKRIIGIPFSKKKSSGGVDESPAASEPQRTEESSSSSDPRPAAAVAAAEVPQVVEVSQEPQKTKQPGWFSRFKKAPQPQLPELIARTDAKVEELEKKVAQCEADLKKVSLRLQKVTGGSTKTQLTTKAQAILQRKKKYEQQIETLRQQSFNFEQTTSTLQSTKDTVHVVAAMKQGIKELKKEQEKVKLETVEDMHDDLEELIEVSDDVQGVLASDLTMPTVDEKELNDALELLGDEFVADNDPSYLDAANAQMPNNSSNPDKNFHLSPGLSGIHDKDNKDNPFTDFSQPPPSSDLDDILFDSSTK